MFQAPSALLILAALLPQATPQTTASPLHQDIDRLIAAGYPDYAAQAAPDASDAEFLRRVTLDLTGTIPTIADTRAFLDDRSPGKRGRVIDTLLASPAYARRMAQFLDVMLMERRPDSKVARADWENYLREAMAANRPYDQLVREILAADGTDPKRRAPAKFYLDRDMEPNLVTRDIARLFLGQNLTCAQCHDHPVVEDYKQADYYGILAFINRSSLFPNAQDPKAVLAEKADGEVSFSSVFDHSKKTHGTLPRLPGAHPVTEPQLKKGKEYLRAPTKTTAGIPVYSRRAELAKRLPSPETPQFARNAVNRLWAMMMGRGLVHPLDLDHSENPPSHPELLDRLATEFTQHGYDIRWLLREIALSKTYQRSSEIPANLSELPEDRYLVAQLKPLTPEQFAYAVLQASGLTDVQRAALGAKYTEAALDARLAGNVNSLKNVFINQPGEPDDSFVVTLDQTLFLKHGTVIRSLLTPTGNNLTGRLLKRSSPDEVVEELFLGILTRMPTPEERELVKESLQSSGDRKTTLAEIAWALIASSEFRFNH